jgi:hypothetical protein
VLKAAQQALEKSVDNVSESLNRVNTTDRIVEELVACVKE